MRVITGKAKGIVLNTPNGLQTRPTSDRVKEAIFSIIQFEVSGANVLDLFAGSGQLGIEALSRGANKCVFIDVADSACKLIQKNLEKTKLDKQAKVIRSDYLAYLHRTREMFSLIFLDPPYAEDFLENSLKMITEIDILQSGGIIVAERPLEKELSIEFPGFSRSKDYKYGNTLICIYRKEPAIGESV